MGLQPIAAINTLWRVTEIMKKARHKVLPQPNRYEIPSMRSCIVFSPSSIARTSLCWRMAGIKAKTLIIMGMKTSQTAIMSALASPFPN